MITLFSHDKEKPAPDDELVTSGSGTAQLSVTVVENDFVAVLVGVGEVQDERRVGIEPPNLRLPAGTSAAGEDGEA